MIDETMLSEACFAVLGRQNDLCVHTLTMNAAVLIRHVSIVDFYV